MGEKRRNNINKIGEVNYNKQGEMMEIIEYYNFQNVVVLLKNTNTVVKVRYDSFKKGNVRDINYPSVGSWYNWRRKIYTWNKIL